MMDQPKYLQSLPKGISIHGKSVRLSFQYRGKTCRETLRGKPVSKTTIAYAEKKLAVIRLEIADGIFNYAKHFPDSKNVQALSGGSAANRTVAEGLERFLERIKQRRAPSTYQSYRDKSYKHLEPKWGHRQIRDIKKTEVERWQLVELHEAGLAAKTVNTLFIVLRGIFKDAIGDQIITTNPLDLISNLEKPDDQEADPLTQTELERILATRTSRQQELNLIGFNARAGLRLSEVLALAWEDIDTSTWTVHIRRGFVNGIYKTPKTRESLREFSLQPEAIVWLQRQMEMTANIHTEPIQVLQRNNRDIKTEQLTLIFRNSSTGEPWSNADVFRKIYKRLLKKAGVRYRGPNQLRHTFASWLLTNLIPLEWIAPMMGTSVEMLKRHYAKLISEDKPDIGSVISSMLEKQRKMERESTKGDRPQITTQKLPKLGGNNRKPLFSRRNNGADGETRTLTPCGTGT